MILEDDAKEIAVLFKNHPGFAMKFTRSVDIPIFSNDELVAFGKSYAEEKEYEESINKARALLEVIE